MNRRVRHRLHRADMYELIFCLFNIHCKPGYGNRAQFVAHPPGSFSVHADHDTGAQRPVTVEETEPVSSEA